MTSGLPESAIAIEDGSTIIAINDDVPIEQRLLLQSAVLDFINSNLELFLSSPVLVAIPFEEGRKAVVLTVQISKELASIWRIVNSHPNVKIREDSPDEA